MKHTGHLYSSNYRLKRMAKPAKGTGKTKGIITDGLITEEIVRTSNEGEIIAKLNGGDIEAVADIFLAYYQHMYAFAANMINDTEAAHDIVLDVLMNVWDKRNADFHTSLRSYLFAAVRNGCLNYMHSLHIEDRNNRKWMQAHIASDTTRFLDDEEVRLQIEQLAADLPEQCRNVFALRVFEGYSYKEIAEKLKISQSAVKVQLHRAGQKLRKKLSGVNNIDLLLLIIFILVKKL